MSRPKSYFRHNNEYRVREIRKAYAQGEKQEVLATLYQLTQQTGANLKQGERQGDMFAPVVDTANAL